MIDIMDKKDNTIIIKAEKNVKKEDYEKIIPVVDDMIKESDKINCILEVSDMESIEPEAFWIDLKYSLKNADKFEKVAIVGPQPYVKVLSELSSMFIPADVEMFERNQTLQATKWITE